MTKNQLIEARQTLGLNITEMAAILLTPYRTYQDWEGGRRRIPGICEAAVTLLLKYKSAVKALQKKRKR